MAHSVVVHQLSSNSGEAYLNVFRDTNGQVGVWVNVYGSFVYFCQKGSMIELRSFDDKDYADEWLILHGNEYESIIKLGEKNEPQKKETIVS